jgi:hypothetical protein
MLALNFRWFVYQAVEKLLRRIGAVEDRPSGRSRLAEWSAARFSTGCRGVPADLVASLSAAAGA